MKHRKLTIEDIDRKLALQEILKKLDVEIFIKSTKTISKRTENFIWDSFLTGIMVNDLGGLKDLTTVAWSSPAPLPRD